jgi:hypothetical protein
MQEGLLFDRRPVLVLEIPQFDEEVDLLIVHPVHALGELAQRLAVETRPHRVGIGVVAIGDDAIQRITPA